MFRYELIAKNLKSQIESGDFSDNRLPSERALMERFCVQRNTIRRALYALQSEGVIATERNKRALVLSNSDMSQTVHESELRKLSGSIVLVVEKIDESTARFDIEQGLRQAFSASDLSILYFDSAQAPLSQGGLPSDEFLSEHNAVGLIVWPMPPIDTNVLRRMRRNLPIVLVDRRVLGFETDFVGFDDERGGKLVTEHLLGRGRKRIGFLSGEIGAETVEGRWRGYRKALEAAGIYPDPAWALQIANLRRLSEPILHGYLKTFISQPGDAPLDAVACASDSAAVNLIHFLRATGRRIPEEVAVVGYGDLLPDYLRAIGLTTVAQTFIEVGLKAGAIMLKRLSLPSSATIRNEEIRLRVRLVERDSCGPNNAMPHAPSAKTESI